MSSLFVLISVVNCNKIVSHQFVFLFLHLNSAASNLIIHIAMKCDTCCGNHHLPVHTASILHIGNLPYNVGAYVNGWMIGFAL